MDEKIRCIQNVYFLYKTDSPKTFKKTKSLLKDLNNALEIISKMPNDDKKEMEITRFSNKISQMEETPAKSLLTAGILREFSQLRNSKSMINEALDIYQEILSETEIKDEIFEMASVKSIDILSEMGKYEEILPKLQQLVLRFPENIQYKSQLGLEYAKKNNPQLAIEIFEQIVDEKDVSVAVIAHLSKAILNKECA